MDFNTPFESALQLIVMAYVASGMLVIVASNVCLAVIETIESAGDS